MIRTTIQHKNKDIFTAANVITLLRIIGTIGLLFAGPMSPLFLGIYTFTGLTDMLDGWVARHTGTASEFGARLDSIADLLFYTVMLIKLLPVLWIILPQTVWYAVGAVLFVRMGSYLTAAIKYHCFASLHTYLNKLTSIAFFLLPYMLMTLYRAKYSWFVCVLAFVASLEELTIHIFHQSYYADRKSVFQSDPSK